MLLIVMSIIGVSSVLRANPYDHGFAYTDAFVKARTFSGYVGFDALLTSQAYAAARRASVDDSAIVPYLLERFDTAPRAGQLYIALVVRAHDYVKGQDLLYRLALVRNETIPTMFGDDGQIRPFDKLVERYIHSPDFNFSIRAWNTRSP